MGVVISVIDAIGSRIDALATKLGVVGAHLWQVMIRQAYVDAYTSFAAGGLFAVGVVICTRVFKWINDKRRTEEGKYFDQESVGRIIVVALSAILTAFALGFLLNGARELANPEYAALQNITELFK